MPDESPVVASTVNGLIGRSVWEMQSTTRASVAYAKRVHNTVFELGSAILAWVVEFRGQMVRTFQKTASDGKRAYERQKQKKRLFRSVKW